MLYDFGNLFQFYGGGSAGVPPPNDGNYVRYTKGGGRPVRIDRR